MAKVLIVDDEQGLRNSLGRFVKHEGHDVFTAEDVGKALEIITSNEIDVVVSDIIMPKVSGVDLLKTLATDYPHVKVILITGEPTLNTASEALRLGAFDYLSKPISKDDFIKVVTTASQLKSFEDEKRNYRKILEKEVKSRTSQLMNYSQKLKYIAENIKRFSSCNSMKELCKTLMNIFSETLECDGGSLYFIKPDGLEFVNSLDQLHQKDFLDFPLKTGSVIEKLMREKHGFVIKDISKDGSLVPSGWNKYRNGSLLAAPVFNGDNQIIATVTLHNKLKDLFTDLDLEIAQTILANFNESLKTVELGIFLRESEEKYRILSEQSRTGIFLHQDEKILYANSRILEMTGYDESDLPQIMQSSIYDFVPESDVEKARKRVNDRINSAEDVSDYEIRLVKKNGDIIWTDIAISKVEHNGKPAIMGNIIDITEKKKTEEEKERLEEELRQSQKMEAIGRLAGGVAHDFNNLLTGITGNISMALLDLEENTPLAQTLLEINAISKRAANLTRQLLAFSSKQILEPKVVNLNNRINDLNKMLARIIGEDIKLKTELDENLGQIRVDPGQVEQIIVNLSVNARDAMPKGGTLILKTENAIISGDEMKSLNDLKPGDYVKFSVVDDGQGIDEETLAKIFEPFFTTKPKGKGTGLGLSTVYGIVKQQNGHIEVESEPEKGTTFQIYFPQVDQKPYDYSKEELPKGMPKGSETVLLAEDEDIVREMTGAILIRLGYKVIETSNGDEALKAFSKHKEQIDLLLTDVVMPGMSGPELAKQLNKQKPLLKILFTSGYTNDKIIHHGVKDETVSFIGKPYTPQELAHKVREVLDQKSA